MQFFMQREGISYSKKLATIGKKILALREIKDANPHFHSMIEYLVSLLQQMDQSIEQMAQINMDIYNHISKLKLMQSDLFSSSQGHKKENNVSKYLPENESDLRFFFDMLNNHHLQKTIIGQKETFNFDEIIHLLSSTSTREPEWLSRTGTILVADPNMNTLQALERRLKKEGHQVISADSISSALEKLQKTKPDAIIIDNLLLTEGTAKFIERLQAASQNSYFPIIVIGPMNDAAGIEEAMEAGASDYLSKPVNPILLRANVRSALEKKSAFEQRQMRLKDLEVKKNDLEKAIHNLDHGFAVFDQNHKMVMHNDQLEVYYPHLKDYFAHNIQPALTFRDLLELHMSSGVYINEPHKKDKDLFMGDDRSAWIEDKVHRFTQPISQWEETLLSGKTLEVSTYRTPDGGGALITRDITDEKAQHQDLAYRAYHDPLTGLSNRSSFMRKLSQLIEAHKYPEEGILAVMFLDLDGFKHINDNYGHEVGDWILIQVANRLRRAVRGEDVVARFGGDEFCIVLTQVMGREKAALIAGRIIKMLGENFLRNDLVLKIGVSIGISLYPENGLDSESLIQQADEAMYEAKNNGKGSFCYTHRGEKG